MDTKLKEMKGKDKTANQLKGDKNVSSKKSTDIKSDDKKGDMKKGDMKKDGDKKSTSANNK